MFIIFKMYGLLISRKTLRWKSRRERLVQNLAILDNHHTLIVARYTLTTEVIADIRIRRFRLYRTDSSDIGAGIDDPIATTPFYHSLATSSPSIRLKF